MSPVPASTQDRTLASKSLGAEDQGYSVFKGKPYKDHHLHKLVEGQSNLQTLFLAAHRNYFTHNMMTIFNISLSVILLSLHKS